MDISLLVLAAGMGSRYGGLKQIDEVGPNGETIIDYNVYDAIRAGINHVVFVIRKDIEEAFRKTFSDKFDKRIKVDYVYQELEYLPEGFQVPPEREKPWGTGHAVLMARDAINNPFVMINADDYYGPGSFKLITDYFRNNSDPHQYAMVAYRLANTLSSKGAVTRGVCQINQEGYLISIQECFKVIRENERIYFEDAEGNPGWLTGDEIVSTNFFGFYPNLFNYLEQGFIEFLRENIHNPKSEYLIPVVLDDLIKGNIIRMKVLESNELWLGVTYKEDKPLVMEGIRKQIEKGLYPTPLWG